jgi:hypothetical protein
MTGIHLFELGDYAMCLDGRAGVVVEEYPHEVEIRTFGTFPERVTVEQGDPAWWNEGPNW